MWRMPGLGRLCSVGRTEMAFQLVEGPGPAFLVAAASLLVVQTRMRKGEFCPLRNSAKPDLEKRLARIFRAALPAPAQGQSLGLHDFEIFAAALMLAAIEHGEAYAEAAANPRIGLRRQHRAVVGA